MGKMSVELPPNVLFPTNNSVADIDRIATATISDIIGNPFEYCDAENSADGMRIATLGAIYGVILYADELRKAVKGNG